jgi:hypothetical protein
MGFARSWSSIAERYRPYSTNGMTARWLVALYLAPRPSHARRRPAQGFLAADYARLVIVVSQASRVRRQSIYAS